MDGLEILGNTTHNNVVEGNFIGTNKTGAVLGNAGNGVMILAGAYNDTIGGTSVGAGNTIANNHVGGVELNSAGTGNLIEDDVTNSNGFGQTSPYGDGVYIDSTAATSVLGCTIDSNQDWGSLLVKSATTTLSGNTLSGNGLGSVHSD
jgi:titin